MRKKLVGLWAAGALLLAAPAANAVVLDFEGLQNQEQILEFYNGGAGSLGSVGPDYDITFGDSALGLIDRDAGGSGNFANEPSPDTVAFFFSGGDLVMNVLDGFTTGFSFYYTSSRVGSVTVYEGPDATGSVLGVLNLDVNWQDNDCTGDPTGTFCNWDPIGVAFGGTAYSVSFAGTADQIGFDDITVGSETPGNGPSPVPAPSTLGLLGIALAGLGFARKRVKD